MRSSSTRDATANLKRILTDLRRNLDQPMLRVVERLPSGRHLAVATVGTSPAGSAMVVKVAGTDSASASLLREADALSALHADPRIKDLAWSVPNPFTLGLVGNHTFATQSRVGGAGGRTANFSDRDRGDLLIAAAGMIAGLHCATGVPTVLEDDDVIRLVDLRLEAALREGRLRVARRQMPALDRLKRELRSAMVGRRTLLGWIHGDYWLGNVVVDGMDEPCGIIDWDQMQFASPPGIDLVYLILNTRAIDRNRELGTIVVAALEDAGLSDVEASVMAKTTTPDTSDSLSWRALVLLAWLHHVTSPTHWWRGPFGRWLWTVRNVDHVLEAL